MERYQVSKRIYWIDILKIMACFFVIVNHCLHVMLNYGVNNKILVFIYFFMFSICKIAVPLFIMCTGYLLLNKKMSYKQVMIRITRILVPLFVISLIFYMINNDTFNLFIFMKKFIEYPIVEPLWYLYMLIGLYISMPFIQKMLDNFKENDYKIFILLFLLIPGLLQFVLVYLKINVNEYFTMAIFPASIAYMVSGVYLKKIKLNRQNLLMSIFLFILSTYILAVSFYVFYFNNYINPYDLDYIFYIPIILSSLSMFYIVRYIFENKKINFVSCKIIKEISLTTFGIYLIHPFFIYKIYNLYVIQNIFEVSVYLGMLIYLLTMFIWCSVIIFFIKKIPIIKKFL